MRPLILLLASMLPLAANAADPWWDSNYGQRIQIGFDNTVGGDDLVDFPVMVKLDSTWFDYSAIGSAGKDLRFVYQDGTPLAYEVDEWQDGGESIIWVTVPLIKQRDSTEYMYMYFDNSTASSNEDAQTVWNEYVTVQHFHPDLRDSSPRNNDFGPGSAPFPDFPYPGKMGDGVRFFDAGGTQASLEGNRSYINWIEYDSTWTYWTKDPMGQNSQCRNSPKLAGNNTGPSSRDMYVGCVTPDGRVGFGNDYDTVLSATSIDDGLWHFVSITRADFGEIRVYVDGQLENSLFSISGRIGYGPGDNWGEEYGPDGDGDLGAVDEIHVTDRVRSDDWIHAQFLSQSDAFLIRCVSPFATQFPDADGDGYGEESAIPITQCAEIYGYVPDGTDCDDADFTIHPAGIEICDGLNDEDCDGLVDGDDIADITNLNWYKDDDSDGFGQPGTLVEDCLTLAGYVQDDQSDCDDSNPSISPTAQEICNTIDDNCDTLIDEDDPLVDTSQLGTFYLDSDGDGWGDTDISEESCSPSPNYVLASGDCDDADNTWGGPDDWYRDGDGDGFGNPGDSATACIQPAGFLADATDCDDSDPLEFPDAKWYRDGDADGFGDTLDTKTQCPQPIGYINTLGDCDDANGAIHPDTEWYADTDTDGYGDETSTIVQCVQPAGHGLIGLDCDDGDASLNPDTLWYRDADNDTYGDPLLSLQQCASSAGYVRNNWDCDDADSAIVPDAWWYPDFDGDGYGEDAAGIQSCDPPSAYVEDNTDCDDDDRNVHPLTRWHEDNDGDGFGNGSAQWPTPVCAQPSGYVLDDTDCNDTASDINPDTVWYLDLDNDTYGNPDEAIGQCDPISGYVTNGWDCDDTDGSIIPDTNWYLDSDGDGYGDPSTVIQGCTAVPGYTTVGDDCDDSNPFAFPGSADVCGDGEDSDCDGVGAADDDEDNDGLTWTQEWGFSDPCDDDTDGDTVIDGDEYGLDTDGDGTSDIADTDDDGDGVPTSSEAGRDTDGDGIDDNLDDDDDGDGELSIDEDTNGDGNPANDDPNGNGIPAYLDFNEPNLPTTDTDGDGILDYEEDIIGSDPNTNDSDGDGIPDDAELGSVDDLTDTDSDGTPDILDADDDGDGINTVDEGQEDTDGDGVPNYLDEDSDGDGVYDAAEGEGDADGDGTPDWNDNTTSVDESQAPADVNYGLGCNTAPAGGSWMLLMMGLLGVRRRR